MREVFQPMLFQRWSFDILRVAVLHGMTRASDFAAAIGVAPATLASDLEGLIDGELIERRPDDSAFLDGEFVLTERGRDLEGVMSELERWSDRWSVPLPAPKGFATIHPPPSAPGAMELTLLGSFGLRVDGRPQHELLPGAQRLLAFLALQDRPVARAAVASRMWPDSTHDRAGISLRSALTRLGSVAREAITVDSGGLALAEGVTVDLHDARQLALRLIHDDEPVADDDLGVAARESLALELLPDWHDEWVLGDADDWRLLRGTALEAMAAHLVERNRAVEAAHAARAAVKVQPLRESSHMTLIRAHLLQGNRSEALGAYENYRDLLIDTLNIDPTDELSDLISGLRRS